VISLLLSIFFSTILLVFFKFFEKYKVDNVQAIVFNYITAATTGFIASGTYPEPGKWINEGWISYAAFIGLLFFSLFIVLAVSSQKAGITITSLANKMSLVIPVIAAILLYNESVTWQKITGIILAVAGIILTSIKSNKTTKAEWLVYLLPFLIFLGSGLSDTLINMVNQNFTLLAADYFTAVLFTTSALFGMVFLLIMLLTGKSVFQFKNLFWGIALGIPNYFSIHFLFLALKESPWESSVVFPVNNMGIVILSAVFGLLFYKEKFTIINWIGLLISLGAIAIISFGA